MKSSDRFGWSLKEVLKALALFTILWWILAEGSGEQWWLGGVFIILATITSMRLRRGRPFQKHPIQLKAIAPFIPVFLLQSLKGGIGVANLALSWRKTPAPYYEIYSLNISKEDEVARQAFAAALCLLPGTLSCKIEENDLMLHVLDRSLLDVPAIGRFERLLAAIFGVTIAMQQE